MITPVNIDKFLQDILFADERKGKLIISLRKIIFKVAGKIREDIKYGGIVFFKGERLFCGIFVRKNHISIEFDRGAELADGDDFLEGGGKFRRHLKIVNPEDIKNKKAEYYIRQCFNLK